MKQSPVSESDLSRAATTARSTIKRLGAIKCPYVGIPVAGRAPFVVARKMLSSLTDGLRITSLRIEQDKRTPFEEPELKLVIAGQRDRGSSRYAIFDRKLDWRSRETVKDETVRWAHGARLKVSATKLAPTPKAQRLAHRYMREIERLQHRLVADHNRNTLGYRLRYCKPGKNPFVRGPVDNRWRNDSAHARWFAEKADRKAISRVAAPFFGQAKVNWAKLYTALRAAGYEVAYTFGRQSGWKHGVSESTYLRQLHHWCGKMKDHPWYTGERSDAEIAAGHRKSLEAYVSVLHEKQSIESEIAGLRQLIADLTVDAVPPKPVASVGLEAAA